MLSLWIATASAQAPDPVAARTDERILPLEVTVNGAKTGTWLLIERAGSLYAPQDAFEEWRVNRRANAQGIELRGVSYWPLSSVAGFSAKTDFSNQSVDLAFSPEAFAATLLTKEKVDKPVRDPVLPSAFFNYDLNYARNMLRAAPTVNDLGLLGEIGVSTGLGVLTTSFVGRNLTSNQLLGNPRSWLRLESTFTRDFPDNNRILRLGDASTRASMLGRAVYFGGLQYGSNFASTPGFVNQQLPPLTGLSAAPSTVELYVNDVLRQVSSVPTGPFALDNLPVITGNGEARLVVRDLLGRETVIVQSFFVNPQLLPAGLDDWSMETGRIRRDLGTASTHYGPGFASGLWRHGYSQSITLESRAELTSTLRTAELGLVMTLPWQTLGRAAWVASRERSLGSGGQWLVGVEKQGLHMGAYVQAQGASINFRQLGQDVTAAPTRRQLAGNLSYSSGTLGSLGLGFASIDRYDSLAGPLDRISTVSGNYTLRVFGLGNLTFTASKLLSGGKGVAVGATLVLPLQKGVISTASVQKREGQTDFYTTASQNPDQNSNLGWRALAGRQQGSSRAEGGLYYLGRYGRVTGDISAAPDQVAMRLGGSGGLVLADGHLFVTRRVDDSFAVVEVAGYGDVGIGLGSSMQTRTNDRGIALVPRLMPYQNNQIRLNASELPLNAELDSIEQIAVPGWRSAVKVAFPVRSGRGALIKFTLADGEPAPAGATVQIEGDRQEFYVARRGEAFVTGLQASNRLRLHWKGGACVIDVALPAEAPDQIARVGPLLCKGITR
ncbi:MAG: fimbrial biosis outer rane usher protein [Polaromonas sp.]|nr:fimbrial biosis outer rane usher protein [Polaromonas sp.]